MFVSLTIRLYCRIDQADGRTLVMNCERFEWMLFFRAPRHFPSLYIEELKETTRSPTIAITLAKTQTYDLPDVQEERDLVTGDI
jgi:hypothetical protein